MTASLILLGVFTYVGVMIALVCMGYRERQIASSPRLMDFRNPWPERISAGMLSLLLFQGAALDATVLAPSFGLWYTWGWFIPICLLMGGLMLYVSGPQDVKIDLDTRTCYGTRGWMFAPQKRMFFVGNIASLCLPGRVWLLCDFVD